MAVLGYLLLCLVVAFTDAHAATLADAISVSGDSIARAFDANTSLCNYGDNPARAWATGDNHGADLCGAGADGTFSHAERLECSKAADVTIFNHAKSGAKMRSHFFKQATDIRAALTNAPGPRYVPVLMGHNDACTNDTAKTGNHCGNPDQDDDNYCRTTNAAFERELRRGMDQLIQIPSVRILILATIRISELCNFESKKACGLAFFTNCGSAWELLGALDEVFETGGICLSLTASCSEQRRIDMYNTLVGYNEVLARVSGEYAAIATGASSATGATKAADVQIRYSSTPFNFRFGNGDLSCCDCFHPSDSGQAKLAQFIWDGFQCSPAAPCCTTTGAPLMDADCSVTDTSTFYPGGFWPQNESCGNGLVDPGETCDAGAANGLDHCCSAECRLVDSDGDGTCDRDDLCNTLTPFLLASLRATGLDTSAADDRLDFHASLLLADAGALDPSITGVRVRIQNGAGQVALDETLPAAGWRARGDGQAWLFTGAPQASVTATVRKRAQGLVSLRVRLSKQTVGLAASSLPARALVVFDGHTMSSELCAGVEFATPPTPPRCVVHADGSALRCR